MKTVTYILEASPQRPDLYKLDLGQQRRKLLGRLGMTDWGRSYDGVDLLSRLEFSLFKDGRIEVSGRDEDLCRKKIDEIRETVVELFGAFPYTESAVKSVVIEDEITADIAHVVPDQVLEVVKQKIPDYAIRDVSFDFRKNWKTPESKELVASIRFQRVAYKGGKDVPLKLTIVAPGLPESEAILAGLRRELSQSK
jgi:hypothetical protein